MPELIAIIDTGVLCCWLEVPGRATAGSGENRWDRAKADTTINDVIERGGTLILPTSVIVETGNHIAQAPHSRDVKASQLFQQIIMSADGERPWRRFEEASRLWNAEWYRSASSDWPRFADQRIGLADFSIIAIARFFHEIGSEVMTLTTEGALRGVVGYLAPPAYANRRRRRSPG